MKSEAGRKHGAKFELFVLPYYVLVTVNVLHFSIFWPAYICHSTSLPYRFSFFVVNSNCASIAAPIIAVTVRFFRQQTGNPAKACCESIMSDDSDDDLLQDVGLSFSNRNKKRKEDQKREALLNIVDYSVEEDLQRRHRQERLNHVLIDHTNVVEQAEGNLESARIKLEANEENFLIPDEQKAVTSAKEISGFDRLGTRPGVMKAVARKPLPDLQHILNDPRDRKLKKYLQTKISIDMLPAALEQGNLSHKFDLSNEFVEWLWRSAIDLESECRDGAFETLKEYFFVRPEKIVSINDMLRQWGDWFESKETKAVDLPDRDAQDCLFDIHHWLMLWVTLIEHASNITNLNGAKVADLVVSLSKIALDALFYEHNHNRYGSGNPYNWQSGCSQPDLLSFSFLTTSLFLFYSGWHPAGAKRSRYC